MAGPSRGASFTHILCACSEDTCCLYNLPLGPLGGSGHNLKVHGLKSCLGLCADSTELGFSLFPSLSAPPLLARSRNTKINIKNNKKYINLLSEAVPHIQAMSVSCLRRRGRHRKPCGWAAEAPLPPGPCRVHHVLASFPEARMLSQNRYLLWSFS